MKLNFIGIVAIFVVFATTISAPAQSHSVRVDSVIIIGNKHTHNEVILREIPFNFPHRVTGDDLETIRNRLLNLHLFNNVDVRVHEGRNKNVLIITVTETWYFYPAPLVFFNERSLKKISVGLQLIHMNFRGMNEKLFASGWLGYNPGVNFSYLNPWLGQTQRVILSAKVMYLLRKNRSFDFKERQRGAVVGVGKRFSLYQFIYAEVGWRRITVPQEYTVYMASTTTTDDVFSVSALYQMDHRDLIEYPLRGYYLEFRASHFGTGNSPVNFNRLVSDVRGYLPLVSHRVSAAFRNFAVLQEGFVPIYEWQYFGYEERLRGYFYQPLTRKNLMLTSIELRYLVLPYRVKTFSDDGWLSYFLKDIRYAMSLGAFVDMGLLWDEPREVSLTRARWGYGFGINFHLPFVQILRLERAWNDTGRGQYIIDVGVSF